MEDNPGDAELVSEALKQADAGVTVVHTERVSGAIERARENAFEVVLLDLSLPDSFELDGVRRLRAEFADLPIVVLTSLEDDRVAAQAVAEGAQDYLIKGQIGPSLLLRSIRYAIARQQCTERATLLAQERAARLAAEAAQREAQGLAAALRESEMRFRAVLDQVRDYAIFLLDSQGRVASWSAGARLLKGWSHEEILGRNIDSFFPPEEVARGKPGAGLERAAREGHLEDEGWRLRKDGSRFLANVVTTALKDAEGQLLGFVKVTRDVTERRRTERNFEFMAGATQELASSHDPAATMAGLARVAVPHLADWCGVDLVESGGAVGDFVATAHVDPAKDHLLRESRHRFPIAPGASSHVVEALRWGEPVFFPEVGEGELRSIARSSEHLYLLRSAGLRSFMAVPLRSRGVAYGAVSFAMTEPGRRFDRVDLELAVELARRAELAIDNARLFAEMQRAVRVREDVLAVVSHDLKQPLTAIQLSASIAANWLDKPGGGPKIRRNVEAIERGVQRAHVLLRDLLDMASIRAGRMAIRASQVDARSLLADALQAHEALASAKGVSLSMAPAPATTIWCDRDRVLQVHANLIGNALKFSASGGRVEASFEAGERFLTFAIRDTGQGITEDALPRVFDAYWSTARRSGDGTGLGLFISKGIVEAHGGRIWIESRIGEGTTVRFTMPVAAA